MFATLSGRFGFAAEAGKLRRWGKWGGVVLLAWCWTLAAIAQPPHQLSPGLPGPMDPAEGAARLTAFRQARLQGDFCLRFQLVHIPRRGDETVYDGVAWGTWNTQGPLTRFQLRPTGANAAEPPDPDKRDANTWEWLVQNGPAPKIWVLAPGAKAARELPPESWHDPLFPGLVYTSFDLLMPFIFWPKYEYDGPAHVGGRVADSYVMLPPDATPTTQKPGAVRVALNREFNALVRAEQLDAARQPARELDVLSFESVQGQWLPKSLDLLEVTGRNKDRFAITTAALNLRLEAALFDPLQLAVPMKLPPSAAWQPL